MTRITNIIKDFIYYDLQNCKKFKDIRNYKIKYKIKFKKII